jgi:Mg2+-importing ATPase
MADQFRTAWFLESVLTELFILLVIRTRRPFYKSRPGRYLTLSALAVALVTLALPYSLLSGILGFTPLSLSLLLVLLGITAAYITASEVTKRIFYGRAHT